MEHRMTNTEEINQTIWSMLENRSNGFMNVINFDEDILASIANTICVEFWNTETVKRKQKAPPSVKKTL